MKKIICLLAFATLMFASCSVNDPIHETPHPEQGQIELTTDWSNRTDGVAIPESYTVLIDGKTLILSGAKNILPLLAPNTYSCLVYNTADKITVNGTTATAATVSAGVVEPLPAWFFLAVKDITVVADTDKDVTIPMVQQVREVNFTITPTGGTISQIKLITATLEGITGAIDLKTGLATGAAMSVNPTFTKQANGSWTAMVRLLDISGGVQTLKTKITFTDGAPADLEQSTSVATQFANFASNKKTPLNLTSEVVETQTEAGFTCTITNWKSVERNGTAN